MADDKKEGLISDDPVEKTVDKKQEGESPEGEKNESGSTGLPEPARAFLTDQLGESPETSAFLEKLDSLCTKKDIKPTLAGTFRRDLLDNPKGPAEHNLLDTVTVRQLREDFRKGYSTEYKYMYSIAVARSVARSNMKSVSDAVFCELLGCPKSNKENTDEPIWQYMHFFWKRSSYIPGGFTQNVLPCLQAEPLTIYYVPMFLSGADLDLTLRQALIKICTGICGAQSADNIKKTCENLNAICGFEVVPVPSDLTLRLYRGIHDGGCRQLILTGAPGTGKTYLAKQLVKLEMAREFYLGCYRRAAKNKVAAEDKVAVAQDDVAAVQDSEKYDFVQFHPSYDYTDFVEGLRPVEIEGADHTSQVTFKKVDGIFKAFCRRVVKQNKAFRASNPDGELPLRYFIIDEINRADLSKVLGELMFCIEQDKRGSKNCVATQYSNLRTYDLETGDYIHEDCFLENGFYIPENVVIIGTMNDIDRSVESFDFALRRRFTWIEVKVTEALLENAFKGGNYHFSEPVRKKLVGQIMELNECILSADGVELGLNDHYLISQGHFTHLPPDILQKKTADEKTKDICRYVWDYRIQNIIAEYVRGESQKKAGAFLKKCEDAFTTIKKEDSPVKKRGRPPKKTEVSKPEGSVDTSLAESGVNG